MPQHAITLQAPEIEVGNSDFVFSVWVDDSKIGELHISKGNVEWKPKNNSTTIYKLSWTDFAALMIESGSLKH